MDLDSDSSALLHACMLRDDADDAASEAVCILSSFTDCTQDILRRALECCNPSNGWTALHYACVNRLLDAIPALIAAHQRVDLSVDVRAHDGTTPLWLAAQEDLSPAAQLLMSHGADPCMADAAGVTPLHIVCGLPVDEDAEEGSAATLAALLSRPDRIGRGMDALDTERGYAPLHAAARRNNAPAVRVLVRAGADVYVRARYMSATPLMLAAQRGCLDACMALLETHQECGGDARAYANAQDSDGAHACMYACSAMSAEQGSAVDTGHVQVVTMLVDVYGANESAPMADGSTLLHVCAQLRSHVLMCSLLSLMHRRGDLNGMGRALCIRGGKLGMTPLQVAAQNGRTPTVRVLLDAHTRTGTSTAASSPDARGRTAMFIAALYGEAPTLQALLDAGLPPEPAALLAAAARGHAACVRALLVSGCDPNAAVFLDAAACPVHTDELAWTLPLCAAVERNGVDVCKILLDPSVGVTPARPDVATRSGITAVHLASELGSMELLTLLLERGAGEMVMNAPRQHDGMTPLHLAARAGVSAAVHACMDNGADATIRDVHGLSPAHWAHVGGCDSDTCALLDACQDDSLVSVGIEPSTLARVFAALYIGDTEARLAQDAAIELPKFRSHADVARFLAFLHTSLLSGVRASVLSSIARRLASSSIEVLPQQLQQSVIQLAALAGLTLLGPVEHMWCSAALAQGMQTEAVTTGAALLSQRAARVIRHYLELHGGHPASIVQQRDCIRKAIPWVDPARVKLGRVIGSGAFGCVVEARVHATRTPDRDGDSSSSNGSAGTEALVAKLQLIPVDIAEQRRSWRELAVQILYSHIVTFRMPALPETYAPALVHRTFGASRLAGIAVLDAAVAVAGATRMGVPLEELPPPFTAALRSGSAALCVCLIPRLTCDLRTALRRARHGLGTSPPPAAWSVRTALQVCHSLGQLHWAARPLLHGDIKSDNVLVALDAVHAAALRSATDASADTHRDAAAAAALFAEDSDWAARLADFGQATFDEALLDLRTRTPHTDATPHDDDAGGVKNARSLADEVQALHDERRVRKWFRPIIPPEFLHLSLRVPSNSDSSVKRSADMWMLGLLLLELLVCEPVYVLPVPPLLNVYGALCVACAPQSDQQRRWPVDAHAAARVATMRRELRGHTASGTEAVAVTAYDTVPELMSAPVPADMGVYVNVPPDDCVPVYSSLPAAPADGMYVDMPHALCELRSAGQYVTQPAYEPMPVLAPVEQTAAASPNAATITEGARSSSPAAAGAWSNEETMFCEQQLLREFVGDVLRASGIVVASLTPAHRAYLDVASRCLALEPDTRPSLCEVYSMLTALM